MNVFHLPIVDASLRARSEGDEQMDTWMIIALALPQVARLNPTKQQTCCASIGLSIADRGGLE